MIRFRTCLAWVVLLVGGCAGAPERQPAELAAAAPSAAPAAAATITPTLVVDANELANQPLPPICRQSLRPGSNVIVTQCMSAADWKRFAQREALETRDLVRMFQGKR
jgi:hypothetical protein